MKKDFDYTKYCNNTDYDELFAFVCNNIEIDIDIEDRFVYFIDEKLVVNKRGRMFNNLTIDYSKILDSGLIPLKYSDESTNRFCISYNNVIDSLCILIDRIINTITIISGKNDTRIDWFLRLKKEPAKDFCEAIQRMLFINQILWQTGHKLIGLGMWDSYLEPYYLDAINERKYSKNDVLEIIKEVFTVLHRYYDLKSAELLGDTGQIFILGRSNEDNEYICNDLTYLFIEAMKEVHLSDPKCLLRVNSKTPRELIELSLHSISSGIGAPLFSNDERVVPALVEYGIPIDDAVNYMASACWEPLVAGKDSSINNLRAIIYLKPLENILMNERLDRIGSFEALMNKYYIHLKRYIRQIVREAESISFAYDPLMSVFIDGCYETKKDISWGGAIYNDIGFATLSLGNLIDSLLNIKKYVFEQERYNLFQVKDMILFDFKNYEDERYELRTQGSRYAKDDPDIIEMTERITEFTANELSQYVLKNGRRIKMGLSGSAYVEASKNFKASFDGRRAGDPFIVHISNDDNSGYTETVGFASRLSYDKGRFNGNVVDLMVNPTLIKNHWDAFVTFIESSIPNGFFQMQMNVVDSKTLIDADRNPEKFPNLIVRVWGFSAYFRDLPEEYRHVLIERAKKNERAG